MKLLVIISRFRFKGVGLGVLCTCTNPKRVGLHVAGAGESSRVVLVD